MSPSRSDYLLATVLRLCAVLSGVVLLLVVVFLVQEAFPALRHVGLVRLFTDDSWHPTEGLYNLLPMLWGTMLVTIGAVSLAAPLAILSAMFCQFYAPVSLARWYRRLIELLAGIPSVVYGFWGLVVLVPMIGNLHPPGPSLLAGMVVLAIMILPTIALLMEASLAAVPQEYLHGALALGLRRWTMIRNIVLPAARSGLFASAVLGVGRALGETMAVLMVCGNVVQIPHSVFAPVRTLTANIALEIAYAFGTHRSALFASGILLLLIVLGIVVVADAVKPRWTYGE
ncbi:MAG: phosphate ABC transporter permease subunit PstC [Nitrospirae bacterium]|nr:MAG: phosphate ABC transporter permease subunit PstC [Nitrospirota bacterium]